jgi:glycosyltransferase involved in cell wall biosynthesis
MVMRRYLMEQKSQPLEGVKSRHLRVCMPTYSFYDSDNRVRRYAETLVLRGDQVDVCCLGSPGQPRTEVIRGVKVYRIQYRVKNEQTRSAYLFRIALFFFRSAVWLGVKHFYHRYDLVHVHNIPDFEVFAAILPRLMGSKVILDIHDLVPELFCSKFPGLSSRLFFRFLCMIERYSALFSHYVIISNDLWRERLLQRSVESDKCSVFLNYPDPALFNNRAAEPSNQAKKIILYPGSINHHQGLDLAVAAFAKIAVQFPDAEFVICGDGPALKQLRVQVNMLDLEGRIHFKNRLPLDQVQDLMACSTLGIVPKRADEFGNLAFSTKILEFMTVGIPVIVSNTEIDRYYFDDSMVLFFKSGDVDDLAEKIAALLENIELRKKLVLRGSIFVSKYSWEVKKNAYMELVDRLVLNG